MSDKFILNAQLNREKKRSESGAVRVDNVALYELERLQRITGLPMKVIATKAILFAAERAEIMEDF